eukprot:3130853-Rhodomonas_salina.2
MAGRSRSLQGHCRLDVFPHAGRESSWFTSIVNIPARNPSPPADLLELPLELVRAAARARRYRDSWPPASHSSAPPPLAT